MGIFAPQCALVIGLAHNSIFFWLRVVIIGWTKNKGEAVGINEINPWMLIFGWRCDF